MAEAGYASFATTVDKTNHVLAEIEHGYGWPKDRRNQSYAALRSVLHTLRDRMTVDQSAQFAAGLPMLIRGMFYEGWEPSRVPQRMNADEFRHRVREGFPYDVTGGTDPLVKHVVDALRQHVSDGEWAKITGTLPDELVSVLT
jgi:uncharacterized protein (DUF2267 family)